MLCFPLFSQKCPEKKENSSIARVIAGQTVKETVCSARSFGPENSPVYYSMLQERMWSSPRVRNVQFSAFLSLQDHRGTCSVFPSLDTSVIIECNCPNTSTPTPKQKCILPITIIMTGLNDLPCKSTEEI